RCINRTQLGVPFPCPGGAMKLAKSLVVGSLIAAGAIAVPAAYAATAPPPTGYLKICKAAASSAVTRSYQFTVSGLKDPVTVPVGKCGGSIPTTLRRVTVTEVAKPGFVVSKIAAKPDGRLVSADRGTRKAVVKVPAGNVTSQSVVTFTNSV